MRILRVAVVGVALLMGASVVVVWGQMPSAFPTPEQQLPPQQQHGIPPLGSEPVSPQVQIQQERSRNSERQKKIIEDTDKLLSLATELKLEVSKSNKDVLSVDVIKKADEIEKLAHSVKERMKG